MNSTVKQNYLYILTGIVALVLVIGGVVYLSLLPAGNQQSSLVNQPLEEVTRPPGQYIEYSEVEFAAAGSKRRVLYFYSKNCTDCLLRDEELNQNLAALPYGTVLFKVDFDTAAALLERYQVSEVNTFVYLDGEGNEIGRWQNGGLEELMEGTDTTNE